MIGLSWKWINTPAHFAVSLMTKKKVLRLCHQDSTWWSTMTYGSATCSSGIKQHFDQRNLPQYRSHVLKCRPFVISISAKILSRIVVSCNNPNQKFWIKFAHFLMEWHALHSYIRACRGHIDILFRFLWQGSTKEANKIKFWRKKGNSSGVNFLQL